MTSTHLSRLRLSSLALLGAAAFAMVSGCSGTESESARNNEDLPPTQQAVGEFILHVQPGARKLTLHRLTKPALKYEVKHRGPGLRPQAVIDANLQSDDVTGSGPSNSVELVTDENTIENTYMTAATTTCPANSFCADVKLNSFWTRTLNLTYAQITSVVDANGDALTGHNANNSDSNLNIGLDSTLGLWSYQSPSVDVSHGSIRGVSESFLAPQGVMLPGVANGATKRWKFDNPDNADVYYRIRVVTANGYANYRLTTIAYRVGQLPTFIDACTVGAGEQQWTIRSASLASQVQPVVSNNAFNMLLPFQFTFYGTTYTTSNRLNFSKFANLTFSVAAASGNTAVLLTDNGTAASPTQLATTSAPRPALFPLWDSFAFANQAPFTSSTGMCAKLIGTAPNRQLAVGWRHLAATGNGNTGPFVSFGVVLNESTDEIWFNYGGSVSGPGSVGWTATIGAQSGTSTTAGPAALGSTTTTTFPNASPGRYVLQPLP